jgi:glucosamine--fructose-6-phosphate aminotransferase (isomerizing)
MYGIVGYVGNAKAAPIILDGLKRLEYRGYDSAGVAVMADGEFTVAKQIGRVAGLQKTVAQSPTEGTRGIGHTRWATHGGVTQENAHPHVSSNGRIAMIHNGVIENYASIKKFLEGENYTFVSETDTEVLCNLISYHSDNEGDATDGSSRLLASVRKSLMHVHGTYGICVLSLDAPDELVAARQGSPVILGVGPEELVIASDVAALVSRTQNVVYLKDGELVSINGNSFQISTMDEAGVTPVIDEVTWTVEDADMSEFDHYILKEIFEQPEALENAMRGRFSADNSTANFGGLNLTANDLRGMSRFMFCACGTALHAGMVTEHLIERYARVMVDCDHASEFRYRNSPLSTNTLFFVVSQSGETIDTLAAMREAQRKGFKVLAINNVVGSTIAREADGGIYQHVGLEIGVASTKAFTSQLLIGAMLALYIGRMRDMSVRDGTEYVAALKGVPELVRETLRTADHIKAIAERYARYNDMLFLGCLELFPIALEGALKLKEISYIHAEVYPADEMKHGPIALINPECPSVFLVPQNELFNKVISSMQEIKARGGPIIAITTSDAELPEGLADETIVIPACHEAVLPILATIPMQLFSYYVAVARGCDVDKPRNLAKSVTVE